MSKSTHSNWKKKPLKKLTCLHFELGPQTPGLVGSSAIFNGAKVFIATTLRAVGTGGRAAPPPDFDRNISYTFSFKRSSA